MNAPKTKSQKCCFCEKPDTPALMVSGYVKKLKPRLACVPCDREYRYWSNHTFQPLSALVPAINIDKLTESAQQNSLFTEEPYQTIRVGEFEWRVTGKGPGARARMRLQDNLEHCACTHKAKRHVDDGQGNLLHCQDCDCDHFWYAVPQARNTDLVVLSACEISGEATVVDKLRTMAEDERTNANERIAAAKRMVAILEKQAA